MSVDLELHAIIRGRVQGVGFRFKAASYAQALKITGTVRNLPDGSVEIVAQASQERLKQFLSQLQQSFSITHIESNYSTIGKNYSLFSIIS